MRFSSNGYGVDSTAEEGGEVIGYITEDTGKFILNEDNLYVLSGADYVAYASAGSLADMTALYSKNGEEYIKTGYYTVGNAEEGIAAGPKAFSRYDKLEYLNLMELKSITMSLGGSFELNGDYSSTQLSNIMYSVFGELASALTIRNRT